MAVYARVNHGRWIVDCPACPSAQIVQPGDTSFVCLSLDPLCPAYGEVVEIAWPPVWRAIEAILAHRPNKVNRNWYPWETLADLRAENLAHGLPEE